MASKAEVDKILDFLQTVYKFRLDTSLIPTSLKQPFDKAVERFKNPDELKKIDPSKMGICEEVSDVTYQALKFICLEQGILTEKTIRTLQDYLEKNHYYDGDGKLLGLNYMGLDELSLKLVPQDMVKTLRYRLPEDLFAPYGDNGSTIIKDFLGGQFVAYISRIWRGHAMGGLQAIEHMRDNKIPEEMRELIEALVKSSEKLIGSKLMEDTRLNLNLSVDLVKYVERTRESGDCNLLLAHLAVILKQKMAKPVTVEDTLHLMFLKMKGRQEMDFYGIDEITMRRTCKPVEYLIEADMFL